MTAGALQFHDFPIDLPCSDEDRLFVDARGFTVAIVLCPEGVVVDVYPLSVADEPVASTWAHYHDLPPTEGELP
ncbi:MAG TPA: hypothetical protein VJ739_11810 [Gemmataceae bacterium]|nr:hypothetical protein [Gemmataceae bacterium]